MASFIEIKVSMRKDFSVIFANNFNFFQFIVAFTTILTISNVLFSSYCNFIVVIINKMNSSVRFNFSHELMMEVCINLVSILCFIEFTIIAVGFNIFVTKFF